MERQKGFTLIELLAVILILGIIALIAIPTVTKIIDESKKGAFETSTNNIVDVIEDTCQKQILNGDTLTTSYTFSDGEVSPSLDIKGKLPTSGTINVDGNCKVTVSVNNGSFTAAKPASVDQVTVVDGVVPTYTAYNNGEAVYFNPVSGAKCTAGEAVSTTGTNSGCMKWYAFIDGGSFNNTINLILDHNTTAWCNWNEDYEYASGPNQALSYLKTDTSSWAGVPTRTDSYSASNGVATYTINYSTYKARLITAIEIATITGYTSFNPIESSWFYLDSNNDDYIEQSSGSSNYAWLFDYTYECTEFGCNISAVGTTGYWTSTPGEAIYNEAWFVDRNGTLDTYLGETVAYGVRPVITISKSLIS